MLPLNLGKEIYPYVILQKYLLGGENINGEQAYAADVLSDASLDVFDMIIFRKRLRLKLLRKKPLNTNTGDSLTGQNLLKFLIVN